MSVRAPDADTAPEPRRSALAISLESGHSGRVRVARVACIVVVLAGCGSTTRASSVSTPPTASTPGTSPPVDHQLVQATHHECDDLGNDAEQYLLTGHARGLPTDDQAAFDQADKAMDQVAKELFETLAPGARSKVLGEPLSSRLSLARSYADNLIRQCDKLAADADKDQGDSGGG